MAELATLPDISGDDGPQLSALHAALNGIERHVNPHFINRVANHPAIYPWVKGYAQGQLDLAPILADPRHYALMGEFGGVLFVNHQPGLYEAHTQIMPEGRGAWALATVRACLHWIFTRTDCVEVMTRVPKGNLGARALAKAIGGRFEFTNPRGWVMNGDPIPADIFALKIQDWMRDAPGLVERGQWFHDRLEAEYERHGVTIPQHDDDAVHDRYVGAACEMALGGQPDKAVIFYNRWAALADYAPVTLMGRDPVVFDIRDAVVALRDDKLWVLSCR